MLAFYSVFLSVIRLSQVQLWVTARRQPYSPDANHSALSYFRDVSRPFGRPVYWFGDPNSGAQITLLKFCFFSSISTKKYVEVAMNYFTMHLIISKWLRRQKCRQKTKTLRQKESKRKKK